MSFITVPPVGMNGIIDSLKSLVEKGKSTYEVLKPSIKSAQASIKLARSGEAPAPAEENVEMPSPSALAPSYDPSRRDSSIPSWAIYAGIGAAVLAGIFIFRSKK
jgi:hypothetical protein